METFSPLSGPLRGCAWLLAIFSFLWGVAGDVYDPTMYRSLAAGASVITIAFVAWLWRREPDRFLRGVGIVAIAVIVLQTLLGAASLSFSPVFFIVRDCLGQTYFCAMANLALLCSSPIGEPHVSDHAARIRRLSLLTVFFILWQLVAGAVVRHTGHGMHWHLAGAALVVIHVFLLMRLVGSDPEQRLEIRGLATLLMGLVGIQLVLGYFSWREPMAAISAIHVAAGALIYATAVLLALQSRRLLIPSLRVAKAS